MFGKSKNTGRNSIHSATTLIASGTKVQGNVHFKGFLEIEGEVEGNIFSEDADSRVRILNGGSVQGEVRVPLVIVNGHVQGDIFAEKQIELASKAVVEGNIHYQLIEIEKGAQVDGSFMHEVQPESSNVTSFPKEGAAEGS